MIDWHEQWAQFAEGFRDGYAHIQVGSKVLRLAPGPGFGDLSHPTTRLMLQLMQGRVAGQRILDVGCGSGILTLASVLLGAESAIGIDIDLEALIHARENNKLNGLKARFATAVPQNASYDVALMNMILSEQQMVKRPPAKTWITSGILVRQKAQYLKVSAEWGWRPIGEARQGEWLGLVFEM